MKPMKLKPEEALFYLKDALCEHCEKECDTCDCIQLCKYGTAYKMAKEALTIQVAYVCKGSGADYPCQHTTDITKAKNFKEVQPGSWIEVMHDTVEKPQGEWILDAVAPHSISWFRCSYCGYKYEAYKKSNFCPNCGSDNRKRGEAE